MLVCIYKQIFGYFFVHLQKIDENTLITDIVFEYY